MGEDVKVIAISRLGAGGLPWQFALRPGETLVFGRKADCDVVVELRGVSACHAELSLEAAQNGGAKAAGDGQPPRLLLRDCSTNGTGLALASGKPWMPLRSGEAQALGAYMQVLVPLNCKSKEHSTVLVIRVLGDYLPDAFDERRQAGRWRYHAKLGEGALGVVYRASDATGRLGKEVAIKVSKVAKTAKPGSRMRNAYILHREAQWSLQRLHNPQSPHFCKRRACLFVRYLEDHTGRWTPSSQDFETERAVFEAAGFSWDKFRLSPPLPASPYVAMELVPGRTLHSAMGWGHEPALQPPLAAEEKRAIAQQSAEALEYLAELGLVHRDFRTTNLMLVGRGAAGRVRVIDLGHTIAAEAGQVRNRSPVVRCSWRESKAKRFDWAPHEVKDIDSGLNFAFPVHAFDVFSLAVLALQLESGSLQTARQRAGCLAGGGGDCGALLAGKRTGGALGLEEDVLKRMLGTAAQRPCPSDVLQALRHAHLEHLSPERPPSPSYDRSRSRSRSDGYRRAHWRSREEVEVLDDVDPNAGAGAASFGTPTEPSSNSEQE